MAHSLNLARRPFIDTRPPNLAAGVLLVAAVILTVVSVQTVVRYLDSSRRTRESIAALRTEIERLEGDRLAAQARLSHYDVDALAAGAEDANEIAIRRSFSWTRFLSRLEKTLPADIRVVVDRLAPLTGGPQGAKPEKRLFGVDLTLISRDPNGLAKTITAFYASPWFDRPSPHNEEIGDRRPAEGRRLQLGVLYRDIEEGLP